MDGENTNGVNTNEEENNDGTVFTDVQKEAIAKMLQSEADRRVTAALAKQKKEYEKKLSLSKLDDDERTKAEKDNTIAELQEQLAAFQIEKNKSELKSVLSSRGLSAEFADIVTINDDITQSQANIDKLDKLFKAAVKSEVEKRLAGNAPKGNGASNTEISKESVRKMSLAQLSELERTQPEVYAKFFN